MVLGVDYHKRSRCAHRPCLITHLFCNTLFYVKVKVKRHEGVLGSGGRAPRILNLGTRRRWVVSFTPRSLYLQGKSPWYPVHGRLGGPQTQSERGGEEKNSQPLMDLELPIIQPVAQRYTAELTLVVKFFCRPHWSSFRRLYLVVTRKPSYLLTYLLTSWCRILFEKLIVTQLIKKSCFLYGTRRFIAMFTKARHWTLSWASWIQFASSIPISLRSILMLSSHLPQGLPNGLLPSGLSTQTL
jgi:hypothetical protein